MGLVEGEPVGVGEDVGESEADVGRGVGDEGGAVEGAGVGEAEGEGPVAEGREGGVAGDAGEPLDLVVQHGLDDGLLRAGGVGAVGVEVEEPGEGVAEGVVAGGVRGEEDVGEDEGLGGAGVAEAGGRLEGEDEEAVLFVEEAAFEGFAGVVLERGPGGASEARLGHEEAPGEVAVEAAAGLTDEGDEGPDAAGRDGRLADDAAGFGEGFGHGRGQRAARMAKPSSRMWRPLQRASAGRSGRSGWGASSGRKRTVGRPAQRGTGLPGGRRTTEGAAGAKRGRRASSKKTGWAAPWRSWRRASRVSRGATTWAAPRATHQATARRSRRAFEAKWPAG